MKFLSSDGDLILLLTSNYMRYENFAVFKNRVGETSVILALGAEMFVIVTCISNNEPADIFCLRIVKAKGYFTPQLEDRIVLDFQIRFWYCVVNLVGLVYAVFTSETI